MQHITIIIIIIILIIIIYDIPELIIAALLLYFFNRPPHTIYHGGTEIISDSDMEPSKTFYCEYDILNTDIIRQILTSHGWTSVDYPENYVDLIIINLHEPSSKKINKVNRRINFRGSNDILTDKYLLYKTFADYDFMPRTTVHDNKTPLTNKDILEFPLIIKPSMGFKGRDIYIVDNKKDLMRSIEKIKKKYRQYSHQRASRYIVSEYIPNPMLINGNKFHMRIYLLIYGNHDGLQRCHLIKNGDMYANAVPYVMDQYDRDDIHNTHLVDADHLYNFPHEYPDQDNIAHVQDQLINMCRALIHKTKKMIKPYDEHEEFHELLGLDILPDDDNKLWLLEVNYKIGLKGLSNKKRDIISKSIANIIVGEIDEDECVKIL